jgi:hypothetical protein
MDNRIGIAGTWLVAAALALAACGEKEDKYRAYVTPIVGKITERLKSAAGLTGGEPARVVEGATALLSDLAGLGADLKALPPEGEKQRSLAAAGQAYLSATQRFVTAQQEFASAYGRLEAARVKVRESLDAKVRTSRFSMDFWKETHDRLVLDLDKVRTENEKLRERVVAATTSAQQAADAVGAVLGKENVIGPEVLASHRKALDGVNLQKGA